MDALGAHRVCTLGNAVAAVTVGAIPALYVADALTLPLLCALIAVTGAVRGLADCAIAVLVPGAATLAGMPLERAAGLNASAGQSGLLLGGPLAGVALAVADASVVLLIDGMTFAVAASLIGVLVPVSVQPDRDGESQHLGYRSQLTAGFQFLRADRLLMAVVTMIAVTNLLDQALLSIMLPVWVQERLGSPAGLGLIAGAGGIGALLGNLIGSWLGPRLPRRATYAVGFLIAGAPEIVVLAFSSTLWAPVLMAFVAGLSGGSIDPLLGTVCYERIPQHLLARVLGAVRASAWIGIPLGPLLGGMLVDTIGLRPRFLPPRHCSSSRPLHPSFSTSSTT